MGDCASRPKDDEVKSHLKYTDTSNDIFFFPLIDIPYLKEINDNPILTADDQDQTNKHIKSLSLDLQKCEKTLKGLKSESSKNSGSKIVIEIQKGKDIFPDIMCFQDAKIYVDIEIVPTNTKFQSKKSRKIIPYWYQIFQKNISLAQAKKIVFKVMVDLKLGSNEEFGKLEIDFETLKTQDVILGWYDIKSEEIKEGKPQLLIRMQYIYDELQFQAQNIKRCEEFIPKARRAIRTCQEKLERLDEVIGPEGRGDIY